MADYGHELRFGTFITRRTNVPDRRCGDQASDLRLLGSGGTIWTH
jgi:hypothetical protein